MPTTPAELGDLADQLQSALLGELTVRRESLGLSKEELSARAGLSRMTVHRAEAPDAGAPLGTFLRLALALNLCPRLQPADETGDHLPPGDLVHRGLAFNRTKYDLEDRDRQRERAFALSWEAANKHQDYGLQPILPTLVPGATQAQATAAATVIQWLGSEVGFSFLQGALEQAGYELTDARATIGADHAPTRRCR